MRRWRFVILLIGILTASVVRSQPSPPTEQRWPVWLEGVNLEQPAQAAFAAWPGDRLVERFYPLPWSWMSFQRASLFQQPIVLVMTVPWSRPAQRMLSETLADPRVLRSINFHYLTILVSADRRPDIRERYQSGTWPVVALLLPDGRPMLSQANPAGVALPISFGFVGVEAMLFSLSEGRVYFDKWSSVLKGVAGVYEQRAAEEAPQAAALRKESSDHFVRWLIGNVDAKNGGFGAAPKFVLPSLAEYAAVRDARFLPALLEPSRDYLDKLVVSPLWDGVEGGVRRLATAPDWGDIQPEKMLEGNVDLVRDLVFALRRSESPVLRSALADAARFVTSDLARPGGGFYNARFAVVGPDPSPVVDRLVLAGPNAMAGAALLRAGALLGDETLESAGRGALDLVIERAWEPARGLDHVIEPNPERHRFLASHAEAAFGLIDAYESTGDPRYLSAARDITEFVANNMLSPGEVAFRDHLQTGPELGLLTTPVWPMRDNVRMARVLTRLAVHTGEPRFRTLAASLVGAFAKDCAAYRARGIEPALALEEIAFEPVVVEIEGGRDDPRVSALRRAALNLAEPWMIVRAGSDAAGPAAVVSRGGARARVTAPDALAEAVAALPVPTGAINP